MKDIKQTSIDRAVNILTALKCRFKVITTDGQEFGELLVQKPKRATRRPRGLVSDYFPVDNMQVGDVLTFKPDNKWFKTVEDTYKALSKHMWRKFGTGSCLIEAHADHIEVLRIK